MLPHTGGHAVNFSCVWSLQLQNEEEPGETAPVVNDAPPPYSSISAESTGKRAKGNSWVCSAVLSYLLHRSPYCQAALQHPHWGGSKGSESIQRHCCYLWFRRCILAAVIWSLPSSGVQVTLRSVLSRLKTVKKQSAASICGSPLIWHLNDTVLLPKMSCCLKGIKEFMISAIFITKGLVMRVILLIHRAVI